MPVFLYKQLFGIPRVMYIVGTVLIILGIITPLNIVLFVGEGAVFLLVGRSISNGIGEAKH